MMYGVLRIVLALGLINLPEMGDHLDVDAFHDFILIRDCMPREMFFLVYCRFFTWCPPPSPKRLKDGSHEEEWDALWLSGEKCM